MNLLIFQNPLFFSIFTFFKIPFLKIKRLEPRSCQFNHPENCVWFEISIQSHIQNSFPYVHFSKFSTKISKTWKKIDIQMEYNKSINSFEMKQRMSPYWIIIFWWFFDNFLALLLCKMFLTFLIYLIVNKKKSVIENR